MTLDPTIESAIGNALDSLLGALALEPVGADRFRACCEIGRFDRVFGGQLLAQAVVAAAATVAPDKQPQSLHATFVDGATVDAPLDVTVDCVRDGRSMATREVRITQHERTVLVALASFHTNAPEPVVTPPAPQVGEPTDCALLQELIERSPAEVREAGRAWVEHPPPLELRVPELPSFLTGERSNDARTHWMRLPRDVGDEAVLHAALLSYASDYFLLDMAFRAHPDLGAPGSIGGTSLDHAIWFHRPPRFERWHRYTQELVTIAGHRGLVRGAIHDADGELVATVAQEVLVRPNNRAPR